MPETEAWMERMMDAIDSMPSADTPETPQEVRERAGRMLSDAMRRQRIKEWEESRWPPPTGNARPGWLGGLKVDTGHLITMFGMLVGFGLAFYTYAQDQALIKKELAESRARGLEYVPRIIALERDNAIQNDRIKNVIESLQEVRRQNTELMVVISAMREDVATVKARLQIERPPR